MILLLQLLINGLVQGALVACMAVAFGLVYRSLRIFHIALGGMFILVGYFFYTVATMAQLSIPIAALLSLLSALVFAPYQHY